MGLVDVAAHQLADAGNAALDMGLVDVAAHQLGQALYLLPNDDHLHAARAEAHLMLCDFASAIVHLRRALRLTEDAAAADHGGGRTSHDAGARAAGYAARLASVIDLRAISLIEDGAYVEAAPLLTEAIRLDSSLRRLYLHRALARTALEQYDDALTDLAKCVSMDPDDADVHFLRAKLSLLAGDLPAARRAADAALLLQPYHQEAAELQATMGECATVYSAEATKLILLGSPADAVSNLTHAMALRPDDPELQMRRGAARRQQGQLYDAARDFEEAIRKAGGKHAQCERLLVLTFNDLGVKLASSRRHADALGWLDRAISQVHAHACTRSMHALHTRIHPISQDPTIGALFLNRGDCHRSLNAIADALTDFQRAAELFSGDAKAQWHIQSRIALVHNERGTQLFNHSAARHAAVEFSRVLRHTARPVHPAGPCPHPAGPCPQLAAPCPHPAAPYRRLAGH